MGDLGGPSHFSRASFVEEHALRSSHGVWTTPFIVPVVGVARAQVLRHSRSLAVGLLGQLHRFAFELVRDHLGGGASGRFSVDAGQAVASHHSDCGSGTSVL